MSTGHYLTVPRAWIYQLTGLVGIVNGAITSAALKTYTSRISTAKSMGATLSNTGIQAAGGITITAGALAGTVTGLLYMIMLFHPGHGETRKSVLIKEVSAITFTVLFLVAALLSTVELATGSGTLDTTGMSAGGRAQVIAALGGSLAYKSSKLTFAYTIIDWICFLGMIASTFVLSRAARHVKANGPAVGAKKAFPERFAEPYLQKVFPKTFNKVGSESGSEVREVQA